MKLSVIIVNYNVSYFLEQCLRSVDQAMENVDGEVWVVDNASVDDSVEMVKQKFPHVHIIANSENVGFSKANNQAISACSGEYVLLLNPDTVVEESTFTKTLDFMDSHPEAGGLGVRMVDGKGNFLPESKRGLPTPEVALYKMFGLNKLFPRSRRFGKYHLSYLPENEVNEVDVLAGAFMMLRKQALDEVGLLDETFFMYGEDIDLSYRITMGGYKNYYYPKTTIIHYKGESTKKQSVNYVFVFYRAMIIFAQKHYSGGLQKGLTFLIRIAIYGRVLLALVARFFQRFKWVMMDLVLMWVMLLLLKDYWEEHIKLIKEYPLNMLTIHFPYYTVTWIASIFLSGGYRSPFDLKKLIRGIGLGTIIIIAIYGLLPNELRHSRGIILFGALIITFALVGYRLLWHFIRFGQLNTNRNQSHKTIIVGREKERQRGLKLLQQAPTPQQFVGFVGFEPTPAGNQVIGTIDQIKELVTIYKVRQVIFCGADLSSEEIIRHMHQLGPSLDYKIIPSQSSYIIGSNSKNSVGEFYTEKVSIELAKRENKRKKRLADLIGVFSSWLLFPILVFIQPGRFWRESWLVLIAQRTWIGYVETETIEMLPRLPKGVFNPIPNSDLMLTQDLIEGLNIEYAKNWSFFSELELIFNSFFRKRNG